LQINNENNNNPTNPDLIPEADSKYKMKLSVDQKGNENILKITPNDDNMTNCYYNNDLEKIIYNKNKTKNKRIIETNFKERCNLLICSICSNNSTNNKENKMKKEIIIAADKIISNKTEMFELWKYLDQIKLMKKIFLNENQCYMMNHIGLKEIVNKFEKEKLEQESTELKDIEDDKEKERKLKLIEYYKSKKARNERNDIDDLLWCYLDDELKQLIEEEFIKNE